MQLSFPTHFHNFMRTVANPLSVSSCCLFAGLCWKSLIACLVWGYLIMACTFCGVCVVQGFINSFDDSIHYRSICLGCGFRGVISLAFSKLLDCTNSIPVTKSNHQIIQAPFLSHKSATRVGNYVTCIPTFRVDFSHL